MIGSELRKYVPTGATCRVEERTHRGRPVFAVIAIVPGGSCVCLNGYTEQPVAQSMCDALNQTTEASV